jgi:hypothetical protein
MPSAVVVRTSMRPVAGLAGARTEYAVRLADIEAPLPQHDLELADLVPAESDLGITAGLSAATAFDLCRWEWRPIAGGGEPVAEKTGGNSGRCFKRSVAARKMVGCNSSISSPMPAAGRRSGPKRRA